MLTTELSAIDSLLAGGIFMPLSLFDLFLFISFVSFVVTGYIFFQRRHRFGGAIFVMTVIVIFALGRLFESFITGI